jgi:TolB-like protein
MRRRRVFRTVALYIVGTWLVMQVADVVFPALVVPDRAIRYVLIAALLGFPAVVVFGWFYDIRMDGIRRTGPAGPGETVAAQPLRRPDYLILTALAGVVIAILYNMIGNVCETPGQVQKPEHDGPPMVAVLPFVSTSLEGESDFFATGVHDDLLTQMAQLQSMRVISRTSVLEYKDTIRNMREIGDALGADAILEGGVQSAGDRIRINAQLIDVRTDEHLWAQTYDRELTAANIFDVQAEIARAIASAMHATLTVQDSDQLAAIPTENMAAYRAYRRAMNILDAKGSWLVEDYRQALEEAIELDPTFTRAMADLAGTLSFANYFFEVDPELTHRAEELLERIRILAPNSADYFMAMAYYS